MSLETVTRLFLTNMSKNLPSEEIRNFVGVSEEIIKLFPGEIMETYYIPYSGKNYGPYS